MVMEFLDQYQMFGGRPNFDTCWKDVYNEEEYCHSLTCQQAVTVVTGLLDALYQLHNEGICHGDFYGHNILIRSKTDKAVKLGDFGGAFVYDKSDTACAACIQRCELRSFAVLVNEIIEY